MKDTHQRTKRQQAHTEKRFHTRLVSWGVFFAVSLGVMLASLSQIANAGPGGALHAISPQSLSGVINVRPGPSPNVAAHAAFVYDAGLGLVYYTKNADEELPQASTTKVMTALLAVERGSLDQMVKVGADAHALVRDDSSFMGLDAGEALTLRDLLYGLVLPSGNDAAVAIADAIGGNVPNFVAMMNARAKELGLTHTHFVNPHGLGVPGHYTTARDLAILSGVAMKYPTLVTITSALHYHIPKTATHKAYDLTTGNDLLSGARSPYPGAIGVKPGYTGDAGYCQAFAAIRHGHLIVGAVLNDPSWQVRIGDMRSLLDWGFEQEGYSPAPPAVPGSAPSPNI
ncbi:MAG TPA: D-alanyl-D-alanine carboxypeptidase family protein [Ktedonobacterales bacterium]